jgi:IclR family transcriptional regulator, acetate operon repressor
MVVLVGTEVRFLAAVECERPLRVGDRSGQVLPAHLASAGKALLAIMSRDPIDAIYGHTEGIDLQRLHREVALIRKRGFAINNQRTEPGVTAIGVAVQNNHDGHPDVAVSISMPTVRFDRDRLVANWVNGLVSNGR